MGFWHDKTLISEAASRETARILSSARRTSTCRHIRIHITAVRRRMATPTVHAMRPQYDPASCKARCRVVRQHWCVVTACGVQRYPKRRSENPTWNVADAEPRRAVLCKLHAVVAAAAVRVPRQRDVVCRDVESPELMHDRRKKLPAAVRHVGVAGRRRTNNNSPKSARTQKRGSRKTNKVGGPGCSRSGGNGNHHGHREYRRLGRGRSKAGKQAAERMRVFTVNIARMGHAVSPTQPGYAAWGGRAGTYNPNLA